LSAAVPQAGQPYHTHDLSWKSSGTPVRYLFKLPVPVDTAGTHVTYRFASDEFDISFAVFFLGVEEDAKMEIVLPAARVNSHQEPVSGDITVHRPGTVILLWDNTYRYALALLPSLPFFPFPLPSFPVSDTSLSSLPSSPLPAFSARLFFI